MKVSRRLTMAGCLAALATPGQAQHGGTMTAAETRAGDLVISTPWTRAAGANANGAGFLVIRNTGSQPDRLLAAATPGARAVELHTMLRDGEVMRMRPVTAIDIPPGQTVALRPGGLHVMLLGLTAPLAVGGTLPLVLRFERAGEVSILLAVARAGATAPDHAH